MGLSPWGSAHEDCTRAVCDVTKPSAAVGGIFRLSWAVLLCVISLRPSGSGTLNDGGSYLLVYARYGRTLHARGRAELRNSAEPVRRWRYLHRVMRTKRKLKVLVYQLTKLHPTRYTKDIRDRFELAKTRKLRTSPVVEFPGS